MTCVGGLLSIRIAKCCREKLRARQGVVGTAVTLSLSFVCILVCGGVDDNEKSWYFVVVGVS